MNNKIKVSPIKSIDNSKINEINIKINKDLQDISKIKNMLNPIKFENERTLNYHKKINDEHSKLSGKFLYEDYYQEQIEKRCKERLKLQKGSKIN